MKARRSLIVGLVLLVLLAVLNGLAYKYYWYWRHVWADVPMHFLGGLAFGSLAVWFAGGRRIFWPLLGVLLLVGIGWELFEFKFSHFLPYKVVFKTLPIWERGAADTFSDILFDVLGGLLAFSWLGRSLNKSAVENNLNHEQKVEA